MKRHKAGLLLLTLALAISLVGCRDTSRPAATSTPSEKLSPATLGSVVGTVVRFSTGTSSLDVTIAEDNPASRDFVSMLPLTLTMEEFAGREKVADLPRPLRHEGSPGSDPEDGHLIYFVPWGTLGFYYNASGIEFSDQTIHLGRYDASPEELARFDGQEVRVEVSR